MFGCIFGGFIGDAAGAYLEFMKTLPNADQVKAAMSMPGGGILNVGPGQGTDDTEMQMAILTALYETNHGLAENDRKLDVDKIAQWYQNWLHSQPFDYGTTTYQGLKPLYNSKKTYLAKKAALDHNR